MELSNVVKRYLNSKKSIKRFCVKRYKTTCTKEKLSKYKNFSCFKFTFYEEMLYYDISYVDKKTGEYLYGKGVIDFTKE
jgi:hypothetical protein